MKMLERGNVGSMELKNRVFFGPVGNFLDGYGPHARAFAEARLKGGAALIFTKYLTFAGEPLYATPEVMHDAIKGMADLVHQYGAKACIQLDTGLGRAKRYLIPPLENLPEPAPAASAVPEFLYEDRLCTELTREQILENIENVHKAALLSARSPDMTQLRSRPTADICLTAFSRSAGTSAPTSMAVKICAAAQNICWISSLPSGKK